MSALQFDIRETDSPDKMVIALSGTIDTSRAIENLYTLVTKSSANKICISMAGIDYVNSAGFAECIVLNNNAKKDGKALVFSDMSPKVRAVFENLGGLRLLTVVETEDEALAALA